MDQKKMPVITISREFAAGGRSIAKGLSERLSIPWFDRDFVKITAEKSGYSEEEIIQEGEELSKGAAFLDNVLNNVTMYVSSYDRIFQAQKESILELSGTPCIIVGRCANIILREAGVPTFDVFLYADQDVRLKRTRRILNDESVDALKYLEQRDSLRENYYKKYTGRNLGSYHDYNICIDTGRLDYDGTVDLLADMILKG